MSNSTMLFMLAESSLHAGTGSTLSFVDLPIQREVHTNHPVIYASSVKGALREACASSANKLTKEKLEVIFGQERKTDFGGTAMFQEARVLLFPVRSFNGVFAWITCKLVIDRLRRDLGAAGLQLPPPVAGSPRTAESAVFCSQAGPNLFGTSGLAVLEDYAYEKEGQDDLTLFAAWVAGAALPSSQTNLAWWREKMKKDIVLVSDEDFQYFTEVHTEIQTHVSIDDNTHTVSENGPWNAEALPPDTLLYAAIKTPDPMHSKGLEEFPKSGDASAALRKSIPERFLLCGNRSLGKGMVFASKYTTGPQIAG